MFDPPLPSDKEEAIKNIKMGKFDKVYFHFPEVFWHVEYDWINRIPPAGEEGQWLTFLNIYKIQNETGRTNIPILLALNPEPYADELETMTEDQIKHAGLEALRSIYGEKVPKDEDVKVIITQHGEDDNWVGAYSYLPKGANLGDFDNFAKPIGNKIFFAGEATTWHNPATVHGAYITGLRAANRVDMVITGTVASPLEQNRHWNVFPEYVMCKSEMELVAIQTEDEFRPACILPDHKDEFFARGWQPLLGIDQEKLLLAKYLE